MPTRTAKIKTINVELINSCLVDHDTFFISNFTLEKYFRKFFIYPLPNFSQEWKDLNPHFRLWRPTLYQLNYTPRKLYLVSLKITCFLITGSYFLYSSFSGCSLLFFVIEYLYPVPAVLSSWIISLLLLPAILFNNLCYNTSTNSMTTFSYCKS